MICIGRVEPVHPNIDFGNSGVSQGGICVGWRRSQNGLQCLGLAGFKLRFTDPPTLEDVIVYLNGR